MNATSPRYALWLMPSGPAAREFARLIGELAAHYRAPGFAPHVTLASGTDRVALARAALAISNDTSVVTAQPCGVLGEAAYYRHLYIALTPCQSLTRLHRQAASAAGDQRPFQPHLSLLYRTPAARDKAGYQRLLDATMLRPFPLSWIALIELAEHPDDWRELSRHALQPRPCSLERPLTGQSCCRPARRRA